VVKVPVIVDAGGHGLGRGDRHGARLRRGAPQHRGRRGRTRSDGAGDEAGHRGRRAASPGASPKAYGSASSPIEAWSTNLPGCRPHRLEPPRGRPPRGARRGRARTDVCIQHREPGVPSAPSSSARWLADLTGRTGTAGHQRSPRRGPAGRANLHLPVDAPGPDEVRRSLRQGMDHRRSPLELELDAARGAMPSPLARLPPRLEARDTRPLLGPREQRRRAAPTSYALGGMTAAGYARFDSVRARQFRRGPEVIRAVARAFSATRPTVPRGVSGRPRPAGRAARGQPPGSGPSLPAGNGSPGASLPTPGRRAAARPHTADRDLLGTLAVVGRDEPPVLSRAGLAGWGQPGGSSPLPDPLSCPPATGSSEKPTSSGRLGLVDPRRVPPARTGMS
jgi:hypothetical protein